MCDANPATHRNVNVCRSVIANASVLEAFGKLAYTESLTGTLMDRNASVVEGALCHLFVKAALVEGIHFGSKWRQPQCILKHRHQ
jgi:hypothetical protein